MKKETWKTVFQIVISILTAIAASLGVTSCMSENCSKNLRILLITQKKRVCHKFMTHPLFLFIHYFYSSDYAELSEEHSCCTDYARILYGIWPYGHWLAP